MLEDGYGNPVTTRSDAARAAYVDGCDRLLRLWPGGAAMLEPAVSADPGFALVHLGEGRMDEGAAALRRSLCQRRLPRPRTHQDARCAIVPVAAGTRRAAA